jgi:hypothetical protein
LKIGLLVACGLRLLGQDSCARNGNGFKHLTGKNTSAVSMIANNRRVHIDLDARGNGCSVMLHPKNMAAVRALCSLSAFTRSAKSSSLQIPLK